MYNPFEHINKRLESLEELVLSIKQAQVKQSQLIKPEYNAGQLLTKKEAATLLGVSASTIDYHARVTRRLTRRYIGKSVRFSREEVLHLAQAQDDNAPAEPTTQGKKK